MSRLTVKGKRFDAWVDPSGNIGVTLLDFEDVPAKESQEEADSLFLKAIRKASKKPEQLDRREAQKPRGRGKAPQR